MNYIMNHMTVKEFKAALEKTKTAVLPVGVVEQHGYHLPLGTDTIRASEFTVRAAPKMNAVVLPAISYCYSGGELPGTINVSPQVFSLLVSDIVLELIRTGFKNVVIFLAHGGTDNTVALEGSLKMILKRDPKMRKISISLVSSKDVSKLCRDYFDMEPEHDYHAGLVETSQIMYLRPELVKLDQLEMDDDYTSGMMRRNPDYYAKSEKVIDHDLVIPYSFQREEVRIGVMGFPDQASAELGKKMTDEIVQGLAEYVNFIDSSNR